MVRLRYCLLCGDPLPRSAIRSKLYCSTACRVKAYRDRNKTVVGESWETPNLTFFDWAESTLVVPVGLLARQPFRIPQWQRDFIDGATADGIREAGLSVARKNGKSGLIAAYCLAYLCGPLNQANWRCLVTSLRANLAKELRMQIQEIAEASGLGDKIKIFRSPTPGRIEGQNGARIDLLAADKSSGHAAGADLVLIDEGGLLEESDRPLWSAMYSSMSGRDGRMITISIQGHGPMFRELRDRADKPEVYFKLHAADEGAALDDREQWLKANPGMATGIKSEKYMADACARAKATPPDQSHFRTQDLNLPGSPDREMLCTPTDWQRLIVEALPEREDPLVIGLDLGGSASMTAAALYWPLCGRLECYGAFPDDPPLAERGVGDGCGGLYVDMERRGELQTYPGKTTPVDQFLLSIAGRIADSEVALLTADRFRQAEVLQVMDRADTGWSIEWRGQGWKDGGEDVRLAQKEIYEARPKTLESLMLESAVSESAISRDPAGNPKLTRAHRRGRIDAIQATVLALAAGRRLRPQLETRREPRISWL